MITTRDHYHELTFNFTDVCFLFLTAISVWISIIIPSTLPQKTKFFSLNLCKPKKLCVVVSPVFRPFFAVALPFSFSVIGFLSHRFKNANPQFFSILKRFLPSSSLTKLLQRSAKISLAICFWKSSSVL